MDLALLIALLFALAAVVFVALAWFRARRSARLSAAQFDAASDASLDAFYLLTPVRNAAGEVVDFRFDHCNARGAAMLNLGKDEVIGKCRSDLLLHETDPQFFGLYMRVVETRRPHEAEFAADLATLRGRWLHHQIVPVGDRLALTTRDITAMHQQRQALLEARNALAQSERKVRTITDNLPCPIAYIDAAERVTFANAAYRRLATLPYGDGLQVHLRDAIGHAEYESRREPLGRALQGERVEFECEMAVDGKQLIAKTVYVPDVDEGKAVRGVFALSVDITQLKEVQARLSNLARSDHLTGLCNRVVLNEELPAALLRCADRRTGITVLYMDVDRFKQINDRHGHATGDAVLVGFAQALRRTVRASDLVVRLGGDEFVVVAEGLACAEQAKALAEKILSAVRSTEIASDDLRLGITTSIGIATFGAEESATMDGDALLRCADAALYRAKHGGRNQWAL